MKLNLYDALHQPNEIIKSLKDADIATLTLVISYITSDLSYIDRIKPYVKGAFDYSVKVPEDLSQEIRNDLVEVLKNKTNKNNDLRNFNKMKDK